MNQDIREQLSALIDNELDRDRTRFLLKRAEHDSELVALWQRWHFSGEAMRGMALPLRRDFLQGIRQGIEDEIEVEHATTSGRGNALRWGGGFAVAASVALAALLLAHPQSTTTPVAFEAGMVADAAPAQDLAQPSVVAPSPYRVQDLRPPYRLDAQTVSAYESGRHDSPMRFDPGHEAYWLRHQQAINGRNEAPLKPWLSPLRQDVAEAALPR